MFWTKLLSIQQISPSTRLSQLSSLHPLSKESPATISYFILPVLLQVSGTGRSKPLLGRSPASACAGSPNLLCHRCMWRRNSLSGARVHKVTVFTSLFVSISRSNNHKCCLCFLSATWKSSVSSCSAEPGKTWDLLTSSHSFITPVANPLQVQAVACGPRGHCSAWPAELHPRIQPMLYWPLSCL